ncbi:DUF3634 family protein [Shewanella corallii]|uniref:DUF3634 family protein n=1 Tax=Shewanella corallii TaxID=560080 RepID=A0ABT0N4W9_9GAMM|nr:DUF3634 family protein [Shewanella corallii]MCL2913513.1 DUF3634 family protein [Shewanella corallii]
MTDTLLKVLFLAVAVFLIYKLIFARKSGLTLMEMHFKDGRMIKHKGKIQDKFEREMRALAKKEKLTCVVRAERSGNVRLHVSANVGDNLTQQIRNLFPFEYYEKVTVDNSKKVG